MTIIKELHPDMILKEYTNIHDGKLTTLGFNHNESFAKIIEVMEDYANSSMGEYDCGIFVFERS